MCSEFPYLVSYGRFVQLIPRVLALLCGHLFSLFGHCTGISFADSTPITVCDNRRISQHKVFSGLAKRGKSSTCWFFGFKLHLVVNDRGEWLACRLTTGNVDDRVPVPSLVRRLWRKLFGDKGYLSQSLTAQLRGRGIHLITHLKSNMKNRLLLLSDKLLLRRRSILETITDQLKNISQIEQTRHRSLANLMVNGVAGMHTVSPSNPAFSVYATQVEQIGTEIQGLRQELQVLEAEEQARERGDAARTLEDVRSMTLERFWGLPDREINQRLHTILFPYKIVVVNGEVIKLTQHQVVAQGDLSSVGGPSL